MAENRTTSFEVEYDLSDTTALSDSAPVSTDNKDFANINLLKQNGTTNEYLTLEHNFSVLDNSLSELPQTPTDVAFFSKDMSDANGEFENNPVIDISFSTYHSSFAFTLTFLREHPLEVFVTWYHDSSVLYRGTFEVTDETFVVKRDVQLYNRVRLEFTKTVPYHYVKLKFLRYGLFILWNELNVKNGSIVQELNRVSDKISINTLSFEVIDVDDEMNFGNVSGMHNYYQRNQPMYPYEIINGQRISLGTYFLNKFSNDKNLGKMISQSYMGIMDTIQFNEGQVYNGATAGGVLSSIFAVAGITNYTIDEETYEQLLYGTIRPSSCRNALKEVLFACHSCIDTTEPDNIIIRKQGHGIVSNISRNLKFSTTVQKAEYVSGVEIKYTTYTLSDNVSQIVKSEYLEGNHKVIFSEPYSNVTITGATATKIRPFYIEFTVETAGEVVISGTKYDSINNSVVRTTEYIAPGEAENIKTFNSTLCNAQTATDLATKLLEYYSLNKLIIKIKHLADSNSMSDMRTIENTTPHMNNYIGRFEKRSINLTGGFIDTAQLVGYFDTQDYYYFTGTELYAGDDFIL